MADRFPGYEVLAKRGSPSWNAKTREVIDRRLAIHRGPRFFTLVEWETLQALCDRIIPQPKNRPPVPLPAFVDQKLAEGHHDGFRYAQLPGQEEAWRRGLAALDASAIEAYGQRFDRLNPSLQDLLLQLMQRGELDARTWKNLPCKLFFEHRVIPDITHAYYAHPAAWNDIGFGGPASPRGYVRLGLDRRDPWEPVEASRAGDTTAWEENHRVR